MCKTWSSLSSAVAFVEWFESMFSEGNKFYLRREKIILSNISERITQITFDNSPVPFCMSWDE